MGFVLATALTRNLPDRQKALEIDLLGGIMGNSALGLVLVTTLAQQQKTTLQQDTAPQQQSAPQPGPVPAVESTPGLVEIPDIREHATFDRAAALLAGFGLVAAEIKVISRRPVGAVVESIPAAGTLAPAGSTVQVAVSVGKQVPTVVGSMFEAAKQVLEQDEFTVERRPSGTAGTPDVVLAQDPAGGTYASAGDVVVLSAASKSSTARSAAKAGA